MEINSKVYVAGHKGMVGSAVVRCLQEKGFNKIMYRTSKELDLTSQSDVERFFLQEKPDYIFLAAARVGGIMANKTYRAEFIYINLQIQSNIIHFAYKFGVKKLLFFSSSCVYPRSCSQPMREEYLWTAPLEPTNEPYAVAKLAGMSMCRAYNEQYKTNFISVIPTNLYGLNDNFDPDQSHVVAALIRKIHIAKISNSPQVILWGTGIPRRELLYVNDVADAALFLMHNYAGDEPINIGMGEDHTIHEIATIIKNIIGYRGEIIFDPSKPDGAPQKLLEISRIRSLGWHAKVSLESGIAKTYEWYLQSIRQ